MTNPRDSELIARVISNTVMGGSGGSITVMLAGRLGLGGAPSWNFMCTLNGAFIGMVRNATIRYKPVSILSIQQCNGVIFFVLKTDSSHRVSRGHTETNNSKRISIQVEIHSLTHQ
jgi:hypothetical protein